MLEEEVALLKVVEVQELEDLAAEELAETNLVIKVEHLEELTLVVVAEPIKEQVVQVL
tara:strand:+ start:326 stop:499 length:174 start_codon:yes stop_codon:yes gene_type:complete